MASNLQLSIYQFVIKEKRTKKGEGYFKFGDFFRDNFLRSDDDPNEVTKEKLYENFIGDFINLFHNEFKLNANETRGIGPDFVKPYPSKHVIDGIIKGGPTGIEQEIFDKNDMNNPEGILDDDKLTTLPYYFKLWTPYDGKTGILMLQSYTDYSVNTLIINHIKEIFRKYNTTYVPERFIPKELKEKYIDESSVYKIAFLKNTLSRSARERLNPAFSDHEGIKIKVEVSGFNDDPNNFIEKLLSPEHIIGSNLRDLEINEDEDHGTVLYYKDENGHQAHAKAEKTLEIKPTIYLPDNIKEYGKDHVDYEKVKTFTDGLLNKIKKEINYSPNDGV